MLVSSGPRILFRFKGLLVRYLGVELISADIFFLKLYNLSEDRHLIIGEISYAND